MPLTSGPKFSQRDHSTFILTVQLAVSTSRRLQGRSSRFLESELSPQGRQGPSRAAQWLCHMFSLQQGRVHKRGREVSTQKTMITASGPITSWQIDGGKVETVTDFIFLDSKITVDGDCSHEFKRHLLLGRKAMTNLDSVLKSRDIILLTKVRVVKAMIFPVIMYGCESWTIKKAERQRIEAFKLWCWRRLLRVPWTARRSN